MLLLLLGVISSSIRISPFIISSSICVIVGNVGLDELGTLLRVVHFLDILGLLVLSEHVRDLAVIDDLRDVFHHQVIDLRLLDVKNSFSVFSTGGVHNSFDLLLPLFTDLHREKVHLHGEGTQTRHCCTARPARAHQQCMALSELNNAHYFNDLVCGLLENHQVHFTRAEHAGTALFAVITVA